MLARDDDRWSPTRTGKLPVGLPCTSDAQRGNVPSSTHTFSPLPTSLAECGTFRMDYSIWQPCHLSGQVTESITLPCNFSYTWMDAPKRDIGVHWRLEHFHSETFIFNYTVENTYTHPNFSGRVSLIGDPMKSWQASIQILNLSESDSNIYFCRISAQTVEGKKEWQSVRGTNLTVITGAPTQIYRALGMVAGAILAIIAVSLGLLMLLAWKKGFCQGCLRSTRAAGPSKERPVGAAYEEVGFPELRTPCLGTPSTIQPPSCPPNPPAPEPNLFYTTIMFPVAKRKIPKPPQNGPGHGGQETTYAIIQP
ncbi:hypothetical protein JRQ81_004644 [Phrynocephalus forsythii]|uniref:Ig-like domain-containing protein n=1 Tax=Phrynocephalus forsythii TaxID=171643 RepID=A0A9Q0XFL8_9SAUR|nr:hypothetical protein JRQ81_004644 [Phrynocephalus forsythii]